MGAEEIVTIKRYTDTLWEIYDYLGSEDEDSDDILFLIERLIEKQNSLIDKLKE